MAVRRFRSTQLKEILKTPQEYEQYKATKGTNIQDVASNVQQNRYHIVVVVDNTQVPVGLITQTDLMRVIEKGESIDPSRQVDDIMNKDFVKISEEKTVDDAISLMNSLDISKLIVVAQNGTFKGVIGKQDIIKEAQKLL